MGLQCHGFLGWRCRVRRIVHDPLSVSDSPSNAGSFRRFMAWFAPAPPVGPARARALARNDLKRAQLENARAIRARHDLGRVRK